MKTLKEQVAMKCIHFNGIMNDECKAGVRYSDVRIDEDDGTYKFPCLKQGGECSCAQFRTEEEVEAKLKQIDEDSFKAVIAISKIKDIYKATKRASGKVTCECGGELYYTMASTNGHIWGRCNSCSLSFK